jgi:hypothetical protein
MSYPKKLHIRKLKLRVSGWHERGHLNRCGHHWINPTYPDQKFSIHEAEALMTNILNNENENTKHRSRLLRLQN